MDVGIGLPSTIPDIPGDRIVERAVAAGQAGFSTLGTIDRPAAAMATRVAAGASARQPHRSPSTTPVRKAAGNIATVRPGAPRPAAYAVPERPASTWSWLKEALFGVAPEVERR